MNFLDILSAHNRALYITLYAKYISENNVQES